jgi:hypothetical protein
VVRWPFEDRNSARDRSRVSPRAPRAFRLSLPSLFAWHLVPVASTLGRLQLIGFYESVGPVKVQRSGWGLLDLHRARPAKLHD